MSEVKLDASGLTTPSIMLGNNVLTSEENKLIWNGEEFKSSGGTGGHNVGEQWISMDGTIPFGGLPFIGQMVSKETYIDLYNWAKTNGRFKTEAEWQTLYSANNGNVSFYAYNGQIGKKAHADFSDDYYAHLYEGTYFYSYFIEEEEYIFDKDVTLEGIKEYANHISENSNFDVEIIYLENETYAFKFIAKEVGTQFNDISITHINVAGTILGEGARVEMYTTEGEDELLSDTFRLPSFKGYLKANETGGGYTKEGLPNITGSVNITDNVMVNTSTSKIFHPYNGAFHQTTTSSGPRAIAQALNVETWADGRNIEFSAQKSNSIYGNSTHVTPETNTILIGVYAFNTIINDSGIEVDTIRQRVDELETLSKHAIGEQWISMDGTIPYGGVPFNGQILNIADYQPLYNWAKDNARIKTESEWQTLKTNNNSNVAYYSDYSSTQFRMPLFRGYLKADSAIGYIRQGLPNITGSIQANTNDTTTAYTGAFYADNSQSGGGDSGGSGGYARFDASRSNAIYGRSSNVTPETSKMLVGVYAFNTVVNGSTFDATNEITSHIKFSISNTHYDIGFPYGDSSGPILSLRSVNYTNNPGGFELSAIDASNTKRLVGKTNGTLTWADKPVITLTASWRSGKNWYRKYSDGWIEQGGLINYGSSAGKWVKSVSLNTSFTSTNYNVVASFYEGDPAGDRYHQNGINIISLTTSSFQVYQCGSDAIQYIAWYACGY